MRSLISPNGTGIASRILTRVQLTRNPHINVYKVRQFIYHRVQMAGVHQIHTRTGIYRLLIKPCASISFTVNFYLKLLDVYILIILLKFFIIKYHFLSALKCLCGAFSSNDSQIRVLPCISSMAQGE